MWIGISKGEEAKAQRYISINAADLSLGYTIVE